MNRHAFCFVAASALLLASHSSAQLAPGDIGVTGFSTTSFTLLRAAGGATVFNIGSFGGTGTTQAILYDPSTANSFLVGGVGFVGRVTITGTTTATYALIPASVGVIAQMSFDGPSVVVADSGTQQVYRLNPSNGAITPITAGAQPWGTALNSGVFDPISGDIYVGANNAVFRIPAGSSVPQPFASGWTAGSSSVSGLAMDPVTGRPCGALLTVNRIVRFDAGGVLTNLCPSGATPGPNSLDVDANGNFIVGASFGDIYRVPNAGGSAQLLGNATGVIGAATGASPVVPPFRLTATPLGAGAATLAITGVPAGTIEGFTAASLDVSLPVGAGFLFGLNPDAFTTALVTAFPTAVPGSPIHWTWPVTPSSLFPASPLSFGPGSLAPGLTLDLMGVAFNPAFQVRTTPVVRVTFN